MLQSTGSQRVGRDTVTEQQKSIATSSLQKQSLANKTDFIYKILLKFINILHWHFTVFFSIIFTY